MISIITIKQTGARQVLPGSYAGHHMRGLTCALVRDFSAEELT